MATRSMIAGIDSNGMIYGIYCHFDGYISNVGKILTESYNTPEKLASLVALGDIRSLEHSIDDIDSYYEDGADWESVQPKSWSSIEQYCSAALRKGADYIYLFNMDENTWRVTRDRPDDFQTF